MAIREWIERQKNAAMAAGVCLIALSIIIAARQFRPHTIRPLANAYFTIDDGATYFKESLTKIPPFDHDGKEAVRAFVVSGDGGAHRWVAYLGKYSPETKQAIESDAPRADPHNMLVKAPGSTQWTPMASADLSKLLALPPGMGDGPIEPVLP
jgi:hypothetical protein